ncbi:hypothetical protein V8F33_004343 [Rhypophila sp. PSN 637]
MGQIGAFLAALLLNLPVVTLLHVEEELFHRDNRYVDHVLRSLLCDQKGSIDSLQNLRSVTMYRQVSTSSHLPLFYLPAMNQTSVYFEDAVEEFHWPNDRPPPPSNLKILEVENIHERHLGNLLSVTPSLRSLTWTRPYYVENRYEAQEGAAVYPAIFSLKDIMSSLAFVRDTLTELRLRTVDRTGWGASAASPDASLARFTDSTTTSLSLAQFENLTILEIPTVFIMGKLSHESTDFFLNLKRTTLHHNLPPRLEELTLTQDLALIFVSHHEFDSQQEMPYLNQLLIWLEDSKASNHVHLRKLRYHSDWVDEDLEENHVRKRQTLGYIATLRGINFRIE